MMEWLIAHNLGILVIIVPMVVVSVIVIKVVDIIKDSVNNSKH